MQKLVDDIGIAFGQRFANLGPRIFRRGQSADLDHAPECDLVPLRVDDARALQLVQLLHRIVDQRRKRVALRFGHAVFKQNVDLLANDAGSVFQHMNERFIFPVDVADEMLGAFRKIEDRFEIDDLRGDLGDRRVLPCQQFQILHVRKLFHAVSAFHWYYHHCIML